VSIRESTIPPFSPCNGRPLFLEERIRYIVGFSLSIRRSTTFGFATSPLSSLSVFCFHSFLRSSGRSLCLCMQGQSTPLYPFGIRAGFSSFPVAPQGAIKFAFYFPPPPSDRPPHLSRRKGFEHQSQHSSSRYLVSEASPLSLPLLPFLISAINSHAKTTFAEQIPLTAFTTSDQYHHPPAGVSLSFLFPPPFTYTPLEAQGT